MRTFLHVLANVLFASVVNNTVWFAVTFWVYLETESVFATGMVAGIFLVATAGTGVWFGSLVDHHRKHAVLQWSAASSLALYCVALAIFLTTPEAEYERRLRARGTESEDVIQRRLQTARNELQSAASYAYTVVNDDLDRAVREICSIIAQREAGLHAG